MTFQLCFDSKVWRCGSQAGEGEKSLPGKGKSTEPRDGARGAVLHRDLRTDWILSPTLTRGLNPLLGLSSGLRSQYTEGLRRVPGTQQAKLKKLHFYLYYCS